VTLHLELFSFSDFINYLVFQNKGV